MYTLIYATDFHQNDYRVIEKEIKKITLKEFEKRCKEIYKEYHPVKFIILEDDEKGIVALFRNKKIRINKIWKIKNESKTSIRKTRKRIPKK